MMNVVILSNSYGEDRSGALIAKKLKKIDNKIKIRAFPLISFGEEYKKRNIKVVGGHPPPPSGGFLLKSARKFLADIAKFFFLPFSYVDRLRIFKDKTNVVIVVGDCSLLLLGYISLRKKAYFLEQCKSNYIHPHLPFERFLIKEIAKKVFTHDKITCDDLKSKGIDAGFVGNPMMDDLSEENNYSAPGKKTLIGLLPGSRKEAYNNMKRIAKVVRDLTIMDRNLRFAVALSDTIEKGKIMEIMSDLKYRVDVYYDSFVDIVKKACLVISLGGTVSEQSLYLETPVISFSGSGAQNARRRLNGQKKLLGDGFVLLDFKPKKIAEKILELLNNKKLLQELKGKGKERAGKSGGARKIAQYIYSEEVKIEKSSKESRNKETGVRIPPHPKKSKHQKSE